MEEKESIVISLGGSMVVPDLPDPIFVNAFRDLILELVQKDNKRFFIIVGGGKTCRRYNEALSKTIKATNEDLDWMGIYSTHLNAQFLRLSFKGKTSDVIVTDPSVASALGNDIIIGAGWKPGFSTDMGAVLVAKELKAKKVINISNIDYVYESDPKANPSAKKFDNLTWKEYRSLITSEWNPGLNSPFDPIASKKAEELGLEVCIMSGVNLENLKNCILNSSFIGTTIK